jgi:hypothetical protein
MNKYASEIPVTILGYSLFPAKLPGARVVSLAYEQTSKSEWAGNLRKFFEGIEDDYLIFGLDDFLPTASFDYEVFTPVMEFVRKNRVARYELGISHIWHKTKDPLWAGDRYTVYKYAQTALYRVSTQFSVWRRDYLIRHLADGRDPWQFEVDGSSDATNDGELVIATEGRTAWDWVHSGAISSRHPDMVNIAGLDRAVIEEMIAANLLNRDRLQFGMATGENRKYS